MALLTTGTAVLSCSFGAAPTPLTVLPVNHTLVDMPAANVMDNKPFANITPFGVCNTPSNPMVAAATAAALGVLTPMPCIPNIVAPWVPGVPAILIGNMPALNSDSKLMCCWGGVISIGFPGQTKDMV